MNDIGDQQFGGVIDSTGDLNIIGGIEEVALNSKIRFLFIQGENRFDLDLGCNWFNLLFDFSSSLADKEAELRRVLLSVPGITAINSFSLAIESTTGEAIVDMEAETSEGLVVREQINLGSIPNG